MTNNSQHTIDFSKVDRMQRRIMAKESWMTEEEFRHAPHAEQQECFEWLYEQCGELASLI